MNRQDKRKSTTIRPVPPRVSVIIVNYNGRHLLAECLSSLQKIDFSPQDYEILLVDNASRDDSVPFVRKNFPDVRILESTENLGFAGGNNLGYTHARGKFIVLLNSDTTVERNWLTALVRAADTQPRTGLFSSRLRYYIPFIQVRLKTREVQRSDLENSIDFSPLGVVVEDVICSPPSLNSLVWYGQGFYEEFSGNVKSRWSKGQAELYLPVLPSALSSQRVAEYVFTFHGHPTEQGRTVPISLTLSNGETILQEELPPQAVRQYRIKIPETTLRRNLQWFIQNAGNIVLHDGYSKDRGSVIKRLSDRYQEFYEPESAYFLRPAQLLSVCGASCLIKREVIDEIGFFDGHYYMYYEDVDFSLRAWRRGWDIAYVPESIVHHRHRATTTQASHHFFLHFTERNHLFLTLTHFPLRTFLLQMIRFFLRLGLAGTKAVIFRFRDDPERSQRWQAQFSAHWLTFHEIISSFPEVIRKRVFWQRRQRRDFSQMRRMMY